MKLSEICLVNTWSDRFNIRGQLSLIHVNDTVHVIEYKDSERSIAVDIDLIELREHDNTVRFTFPRGSNDRLIFKIEDQVEFSVLTQAREDSQAICDMKLRLNSILRDSYYSGIYSNLDPDAKLILGDEIDRMKKENPGVFFSSLLNARIMRQDTSNSSHTTKNEDSTAIALADVQCVFCDAPKLTYKELDFLIHPNVPTTSDGKNIYMCSICIENWKEYREIAEHEDQLVLEGEINEEICAICSDTPSTLVLCGNCPRSYCNNCLQRILTTKELNELNMNPDADWLCMCCNTGFSDHPVLCRTVWKMVQSCPGRRGLHYGTIVPYSRTGQHALQSNNNSSNKTEHSSKVLSNDAMKLKSALGNGLPIDLAVAKTDAAANVPLLMSLTGKNTTVSTPKSMERRSSISAEEDISPRVSSRRQHHQAHSSSTSSNTGSSVRHTAPQKGRRPQQTLYDIEDVVPEKVLQNRNKLASSSNNRKNRMEKRYGDQAIVVRGSSGGGGLQSSGIVLDEKYYFSQYVCYYNLLCQDISRRTARIKAASAAVVVSSPKSRGSSKAGAGSSGVKRKYKAEEEEVLTDDVCFLCKDGGDLIECDWRCSTAKHGERCLKVYHSYCLDFEVADDKNWCCPRHYCDMCGNQTLKYICKYCPVSLCANCPETFVKKYGQSRYCVVSDELSGSWGHTPTAAGMQTIVCQTCTEMLESIDTSTTGTTATSTASTVGVMANPVKGSASTELVHSELLKEKRFPGKYSSGGKLGMCSIYLKDTTDSSNSSSSHNGSRTHNEPQNDIKAGSATAVAVSAIAITTDDGGPGIPAVAVRAVADLSEDQVASTTADDAVEVGMVVEEESIYVPTTTTTTTSTTPAVAIVETRSSSQAEEENNLNNNAEENNTLNNKQSSETIDNKMEIDEEIALANNRSSTDEQATANETIILQTQEIKQKERMEMNESNSETAAQERGLVSITPVEQLAAAVEPKSKGSSRKNRQKNTSSNSNSSCSGIENSRSSNSCSSSSNSTTSTTKIVAPLPSNKRSRAQSNNNNSSSSTASASGESTSTQTGIRQREGNSTASVPVSVPVPTPSTTRTPSPRSNPEQQQAKSDQQPSAVAVATSGIRSAERSSPPKKRAASSAATLNISLQLKSMSRPTPAATTTSVTAAVAAVSVERAPSMPTRTENVAAEGDSTTSRSDGKTAGSMSAAVEATASAVSTRTKSSTLVPPNASPTTVPTAISKKSKEDTIENNSSDDDNSDDDEVVIHIAKRITRRDVAAGIAELPPPVPLELAELRPPQVPAVAPAVLVTKAVTGKVTVSVAAKAVDIETSSTTSTATAVGSTRRSVRNQGVALSGKDLLPGLL